MTANDWSSPKTTTNLDVAFGPEKIADFLPAMNEIPEEFHSWGNPWQKIVSDWFFKGMKEVPTAKAEIDAIKALAHIHVILRSFEPKHEHKIAGCAYLMSLWFEMPKK